MTNLKENMEQATNEAVKAGYASQSGDTNWYKFTEGENIFRLLTPFVTIFTNFHEGICFTDCGFEGTPREMCYVLDQKETNIDGEIEPIIKLAQLPRKIANQIASYQTDEDYGFDSLPMPYDIKVMAEKAGTKEVQYTVTPRKEKELDKVVLEQLAEKTPIKEIVEKMKAKNMDKHGKATQTTAPEYPEATINPEDVSF